jgi:hypothetical protein
MSTIEKIENSLSSIDPDFLYHYLQDQGWQEEEQIDDIASILSISLGEEKYSLLLPKTNKISDYDYRILDALKVLEKVEKKDKSELIKFFISTQYLAQKEKKEILSLRFQFVYDKNQNHFPAQPMGEILTELQKLFIATGKNHEGIISKKGKKKEKEIKEETEISIFETFKGSFGIKFSFPSAKQLDLFEPPLAEKVSRTFLDLIKLSNENDKRKLKELFSTLDRKSASSYRKFLTSIGKVEINLHTNWGSVNPNAGGSAYLEYSHIVSTIEFINKQEREDPYEFVIIGKLIAADAKTRNKNIQIIYDTEDKIHKVLKANYDDELLKQNNVKLTIGETYSVKVQEITYVNPSTAEEKVDRTIIDIRKVT